MKPVKNLLLAALLVSAMSISTFAGVQDTPGYVEPPPPRQTTASDTTINNSDTEEAGGIMVVTSDYLFIDALAALLSVY